MGFQPEKGKKGSWDILIRPPGNLAPKKPVVVEVKSREKKGNYPLMDDLRQLDDWVFQLSGAEEARKKNMGGKIVTTVSGVSGALAKVYPSLHKGVMVFNGPTEIPFKKRLEILPLPQDIKDNRAEFARSRNICIILLECLLSWYNDWQNDESIKSDFWKAIHSTCGILQPAHL